MQTIPSARVAADFHEAASIAKTGEPVAITQSGKPAFMLMTYEDGAELLRLRNIARVRSYMNERREHLPADAPALDMDDIDALIRELRA